MTDITPQTTPLTFIDNPHAPEVFASGPVGFFFNSGNLHITLTALRADHKSSPGPVNRVVVGRLVLPLVGAHNLAVGVFDFLKRNNLDPASLSEQATH
jgi:hypothetical protein